MKNLTIILVVSFCYYFPQLIAQTPVRCLSVSPAAGLSEGLPTTTVQENVGNQQMMLTQRSVVSIPVVVHIVWNKQEENIPDEQIISQIEVLNSDYRATNFEIPGIPSIFKSKIADVEFEFCLASVTPDGQPTTGITRTFTNNSIGIGGTKAIHFSNQGGQDAWDPAHYLNIWVAKFAGGVGGTATFPGQAPAGEDGVEIDYRQFGTLNTQLPYHLGRTCTHEIGHYFNLEHVWGPNINSCCDEDDFVADTPNACETYLLQCPTHPVFSCSEPDMFMNYMFYTDDACMGMFTQGQKARMWNALNQFRPGLLDSPGCGMVPTEEPDGKAKLTLYGNPMRERLMFEIKSKDTTNWELRLFDILGRCVIQQTVRSNQVETIDLPVLLPGVYFLEAMTVDKKLVAKVVAG